MALQVIYEETKLDYTFFNLPFYTSSEILFTAKYWVSAAAWLPVVLLSVNKHSPSFYRVLFIYFPNLYRTIILELNNVWRTFTTGPAWKELTI